jgi:hypothetical protein
MRYDDRVRLAVVIALVWVGTAWAEPAKPWAAGVPEAEQTTALAMYREGNTEFQESRYAQALVKYRDALKHWDHPAIRFNMAVCLVNLDQPLEAYEHLTAALKYNDAPIGADAYAQGLTYKKLLLGQLANLKVTSDVDGAEVTLDGKPVLKGKGEATQMVVPGAHQVVAAKPGFVTETAALVLLPGKDTVHAVHLLPIVISTHMVRRWNARTPWIVLASGVGGLALGGIVELSSRSEYHTYDQLLVAQCPHGCGSLPGQPALDPDTQSHETRAKVENVFGVSLLTLGSAAVVAGLVGVYLNLPRSVVEHGPTIAPAVGAAGTGASLSWSF